MQGGFVKDGEEIMQGLRNAEQLQMEMGCGRTVLMPGHGHLSSPFWGDE
jgi:hypothetical protein